MPKKNYDRFPVLHLVVNLFYEFVDHLPKSVLHVSLKPRSGASSLPSVLLVFRDQRLLEDYLVDENLASYFDGQKRAIL